MNKKLLPIVRIGLILILAGLSLGLTVNHFLVRPFREKGVPLGAADQPTSLPEPTPAYTHYTNEEYGFSLSYPAEWALPKEVKIDPSQQHLYQITFNPSGRSYMVNIYSRPAPVSLGSFVRDYFKNVEGGVNWTKEIEINGQEGLQFFIPRTARTPSGIGGAAFGKKGYILTMTTSSGRIPEGDFKQLVNEKTLTQLAESFKWLE